MASPIDPSQSIYDDSNEGERVSTLPNMSPVHLVIPRHGHATQAPYPQDAKELPSPVGSCKDSLEPQGKTQTVPRNDHTLASSQHTLATISEAMHDMEGYNPMGHWEEEKFEDQPWHGLERL